MERNAGNKPSAVLYRCSKRLLDLVVCLILLVPALCTMAVVAVAIKLESNGPVFYNDQRIGKDGKLFLCYKFRSMYTEGDNILRKYLATHEEASKEWDEFQKLREYDPRVTRVGQYIRKLSMDEFPQILNVLLGDMSLVGPRPYLPREKDDMGEYYTVICQVLPGVTGPWQVNGRNDINFVGRLKMDEEYVHNRSLLLDLKYMLQTVKIVCLGRGAY